MSQPNNVLLRFLRGEAISWILLALILVFLSMTYGFVASHFNWWPSGIFKPALEAGDAAQEKWRPRDRYDDTNLFLHSRHTRSGLLRHNPQRSFQGYTLYTSGHENGAFLLDADGKLVHQWRLPFSKAWPSPPHVDAPLDDEFIFWRKAHLFPNGDVIAVYEASGDTPYGYGVVKVNKDSELIWRYPARNHHDLDVGPDGKVYLLDHAFESTPMPGSKVREYPYLGDSISVLSPEGKRLKHVSITQAFKNSPFADSLRVYGDVGIGWDVWHTNSVEVLRDDMAEAFPFLKPGQVLISIRHSNMLAAIDLDTEQVVWATIGPWHRQHDADFLPDGSMLLFDNQGHHGPGGGSRILRIDPASSNILWQYAGTADDPFQSSGRGSQQALPNGNVLIAESHQGRLLEVTPDQEVVWEYVTPHRSPKDHDDVAVACSVQRMASDEIQFSFNTPSQSH